ncbi:MAG: tRNA 2-thiouridine(34) synthase MnmA [Pseudomonadales bacterium]|nr:tRNA 2-thiouridine(34) synthase MnmA [Pseudomonadales bacterium]
MQQTTQAPIVITGMSGGVDSSVAAMILLNQGYQVQGLFMKNWDEDDGSEYCTAKEDLADAHAVCKHLGIKLHEANFSAEYWDNVFQEFLVEYRAGRTPNPDILCNREIKFNVFREYAELLGADFIATGHYVRTDLQNGKVQLLKAVDENKDQSYFLQSVSAEQLSNCIFPLGNLKKTQVRIMAQQAGLSTHSKKDSTGICFIGERRFSDFLSTYIPHQPGLIKNLQEEEMGKHQGVMFHTLGQRQGLGIGGVKNGSDEPWYVVRKNVETNVLYVAQGNNHPALFSQAMSIKKIEWIDGSGPEFSVDANNGTAQLDNISIPIQVKVRYRQADQQARLSKTDDGYQVVFDSPQRAVTPGQWACFYEGDICLGGGIIENVLEITAQEI